ncbi:MAG: CHAD domain-containing protein [Gemmatimonadaceae bacterium]
MKDSVLEESALKEPAERGVRLVALSLVEDVQEAAEKLTGLSKELLGGEAEGDDAVHDFRVAVRRLRSWVSSFKPWIDDDVPKKRRRRLSKIADATRESRDSTVHLEWLKKQRESLSARQRVGQSWLSDRLEKQRKDGAEKALEAADESAATSSKLTRKIEFYRAPLRGDGHSNLFGIVVAEQIVTAGEKLWQRLAAIDGFTHVETAHRARIAAKNLRYVVEPVAKLFPSGGAIIDTLKKLQDSLGDLHDVHVFAAELVRATEKAAGERARRVSEVVMADDETESENDRIRKARSRDPGPGLLALARLLHERGMQAYKELERDWLYDAGAEFFDRLRAFAAEIGKGASRGEEIEHKYLLKALPALPESASSTEIEQAYVPGEKVVERIRHVRYADGGEKWFRTIKSGNGLERMELEEETDPNLARAMWRLAPSRVCKRRYTLREADGFVWEIDEFVDRDLVLAEIELPTADTEFVMPSWLADVMVREVTDDPEYSNARLAESPAPPRDLNGAENREGQPSNQ